MRNNLILASILVPMAFSALTQRATAKDFSTGDTTLQIGALKIPLYRDLGNLKSDDFTAPLSGRQYPATCEGGYAAAHFSIKTSGNCATISYANYDGKPIQPDVEYCTGTAVHADGRNFKLVEVMDRCLIHPTNRKDEFYSNLFYTSPLIRLQDESGTMWVTEFHDIQKLMKINQTHVVEGSGDCPQKHELFGEKSAKKCAVDLAKQEVGEMCTSLGGKVQAKTLQESEAPWMCYTEIFAEEFCASYKATCDF